MVRRPISYGESGEGRTPGGGDRGLRLSERVAVKEGHGRRERKREIGEGAIEEKPGEARQGTGEKARRKEEEGGR